MSRLDDRSDWMKRKLISNISPNIEEFLEREGEKLAVTRAEAVAFLAQMENVRCENGRYYSVSDKSRHVAAFIVDQNEKRPNKYQFRPQVNPYPRRNLPTREQISYADLSSNHTNRPNRITNRRMTLGTQRTLQERQPVNRRSSIDVNDSSNRNKRSRSRSPHKNRWDDRNNRRSPSRPPRRDVSTGRNDRGSRRSPSPSKHSRRHERSPSPKRPSSRLSRSPPRLQSQRKKDTESQSIHNAVTKVISPKDGPSSISETPPIERETTKRKKFKFTVIGDSCIYYMLSDMQDDMTLRNPLCNHTQTMGEATRMVQEKMDFLQKRKKKVLISIGATDLRNDRKLFEMKRDFTVLFLVCDGKGLKPLITTVVCFDTPVLKRRADHFNEFLLTSFENVIDMRLVGQYGFEAVLSNMNKQNVIGRKI